MVELVTKSGTNHFHGQLFELNQNNFLKAKSAFSGPTINYLMRNEYGGQLGGPVWLPKIYNGKNKTFFFVDLEGIRQNSNADVSYVMVPTAMRSGDLSGLVDSNGNPITIYDPLSTSVTGPPFTRSATPFMANGKVNQIPANRLNPIVQKIFKNYLPQPNISGADYWTGTPNYRPTGASSTLRNKLYTAKVDQLFGPNRLAMRYTYTSRNTLTPESTYYVLEPATGVSGGHNGAVVFTEVLGSHAINVLRGGVQYNHNFGGPLEYSTPPATSLGLPNYVNSTVWPSFYWKGSYDGYWDPIDRGNPKDYPDQTVTGSDQFSYNRGNHQMMFGFEVSNYRLTTSEVGQPGGGYNYAGNFTGLQDPAQVAKGTYDASVSDTGSGLADFLLGETDAVDLNTYPVYHTRQTEFNGFAQDNWRVTQNLTLNLGLRYEYWTAFADSSGRQSTFDPSVAGGIVVYQGSGAVPANTNPAVYASFKAAGLPIESAAVAHYPLSLWKMPHNNWEPRLGFAYELNSKTVLRGGWGIYQWVMPLVQYQQQSRKNPPFSYSSHIDASEFTNGVYTGVSTDAAAAELEFPHAQSQFGGPMPPPYDQLMLGAPTLTLNTSAVNISFNGGFGIAPFVPDYKPQTVQEYNLSFARELPKHIGFQLSYIGNHSYNLPQEDPFNYTIPRELCATSESTDVAQCQAGTAQFRRAYPLFSTSGSNGMEEYRYDGYSNTNELQAQVQHTFGNGLLLQSYFTWQRTLTTTEGSAASNVGTSAQMVPAALTPGYTLTNPNSGQPYAARQRAMYAPDSSLPTKTFSINAHYEFPFGRGKRYLGNSHGFVNELVSGYNISPFFLWHSGFYFSPYFSPFGSSTILAPGKTGILPEGKRTRAQWFDASVDDQSIGQPYTGQTYIVRANTLDWDFRNNISRNYMTGPGFNEMDATIYKLTPIAKGSVLDIEAQIFNVYNHQNLALPGNKGNITQPLGSSLPRLIQLQAKFIF